jgi:hypothetical protein
MKLGVNKEHKMSKKGFSLRSFFQMIFGVGGMVFWVAWGVMGLSALCVQQNDLNGMFIVSLIWAFGVLCNQLFAFAKIGFFNVAIALLLPSALEQLTSLIVIWSVLDDGLGLFSKLFICAILAGVLLVLQIIKAWFLRDLAQKAIYYA